MITHVLLDLDATIICSTDSDKPSLSTDEYKRLQHLEHHRMDDLYTIFERPFLQKFLDYLFANYKVSVFTASSKNYCLFIIDKFILTKPERKLEFVFFSYHCNLSKNKYNGNNKRLSLLNFDFELADIFPLETTVLIDDHEGWIKDQSEVVLTIKPYDIYHPDAENDVELVTTIAQLELRREAK